jgi:hypothetical protein
MVLWAFFVINASLACLVIQKITIANVRLEFYLAGRLKKQFSNFSFFKHVTVTHLELKKTRLKTAIPTQAYACVCPKLSDESVTNVLPIIGNWTVKRVVLSVNVTLQARMQMRPSAIKIRVSVVVLRREVAKSVTSVRLTIGARQRQDAKVESSLFCL